MPARARTLRARPSIMSIGVKSDREDERGGKAQTSGLLMLNACGVGGSDDSAPREATHAGSSRRITPGPGSSSSSTTAATCNLPLRHSCLHACVAAKYLAKYLASDPFAETSPHRGRGHVGCLAAFAVHPAARQSRPAAAPPHPALWLLSPHRGAQLARGATQRIRVVIERSLHALVG